MEDAINKHTGADVLINFASLRSAYDSTIETLKFPQVCLGFLYFVTRLLSFVCFILIYTLIL